MNEQFINTIRKHKLILVIFIVLFLVYMFYHYKANMGTFFDIPSMFLIMYRQTVEAHSNYFLFINDKVRFYCDLLVSIPFNTYLHLFEPKKFIDIISFYGTSYLIIHFFALCLNFLTAIRTKRFDIAIYALAFYTFFSMSNLIWCVKELHIAILFQFILLSFFLSKEKLKKTDIIPISILLVFMLESYEIIIIFGIILFISAITYLVKKKETLNIRYKLFIGIGTFCASIHTIIKMFYINKDCLGSGLIEWINGIKMTSLYLFKTNLIIMLFALLYFIIIIFYKKELTNKIKIALPLLLFPILVSLSWGTHFSPDPNIEIQFFGVALIFIFPVEIAIILLDYFDIKIENHNKTFFSNLFFLACFIGIINICWQLIACHENSKYITYLKELYTKSDETIITMPIDAYNDYNFMKYDTCFGNQQKTIFISDDYVVNKIFSPNKNSYSYNPYCFEDKEHTFYDNNKDILVLQTAPLYKKTKYYDATPIVNEFEETELLGNYKYNIPTFSYKNVFKELLDNVKTILVKCKNKINYILKND